MLDRKADTRKKIALGGLLIKAGFGSLHPEQADMVYGMLLDCWKKLAQNPELKQQWKRLGVELASTKPF